MKFIWICTVILLAASSLSAQDLPLIDSALSQVSLTHEDVGFDQLEMATYGGDRWRSTYFTLYHNQPFTLPRHADMTITELTEQLTNPTGLLSFAGRRVDSPIRRTLIGDPIEKYVKDLDGYGLFSITGKRNVLIGAEYKPLRNKADVIYRLIDDENSLFRRAVKPIDEGDFRRDLWKYFLADSAEYADRVEEIYRYLDMDRLVAGAQDVAEVVNRVIDSLEYCTFPDYVVEIKTNKGKIYVGTAGPDKYEYIEAPLMIIDGGGDDTYWFPNENSDAPLSIIIDLAGNDTYKLADSTKPSYAGAVCGMSVLVDLAGDDIYESHYVGQGAAIFGVGLLIDKAGNDTYTIRKMGQGAGAFGLGILADSSGSDSLFCWQLAQGYGYTRGAGVLVNYEGDDVYVAKDDSVFDASPQTADHNVSLAQGVGYGRRADYLDGHSWAGGFGLLCDMNGKDRYLAGLFAQGCAYWFSVGMLLDGGGADQYNGVWYVQGAGAHFGVAYLDDYSGDDTYTATHNMAVGAGHDFTIGYFHERGGNDRYTVPNLSLGGGNANGIGVFEDHGGNDVYTTKENSTTLGRANPGSSGPRQYLRCFGIFVDSAGNDTYSERWAGNGMRWLGPQKDPDNPSEATLGVGIDR